MYSSYGGIFILFCFLIRSVSSILFFYTGLKIVVNCSYGGKFMLFVFDLF